MREMKIAIPLTPEYHALHEVITAARAAGGQFEMKVDAEGSITLSAGDKSAFVHADDPMNQVFRREWWGIRQQ